MNVIESRHGMDKDLRLYAEDFKSYIDGVVAGQVQHNHQNVFTEIMLDTLQSAGEVGIYEVEYFRRTGIQINGYSINEDGENISIDLYISLHTRIMPPITINKNDWEPVLKRGFNFFKKSLNGLYKALVLDSDSENSNICVFSKYIYDNKSRITNLRLFFFTDGLTKAIKLDNADIEGIEVTYHSWDMERFFRLASSGKKREIIEIDFEEKYGIKLPCLEMPVSNDDYNAYLTIIPGTLLSQLYEEYGERLIERNVRSFLQFRGVNKGIKETIIKEPHMFLAYNNGISATAEQIVVAKNNQGVSCIKAFKDLQIVNGGQTTASIYHSIKKEKDADISKVFVQMKITEIKDAEKMDDVVPRISEYANSQNKIQTADFYANDPYHRKLEQLSRTIWAPAKEGKNRQTKWFYERARGQYLGLKNRELTPARKREFDEIYPKAQLITKTDLAKYMNSWNQLPHIVSRGAQKNFVEFAKILQSCEIKDPDQEYFQEVVTKAILYNETTKLVPYKHRANIVTYTIAWLSNKTEQAIGFEEIWRKQELPESLKETIIKVMNAAHKHITNPPTNQNFGEWAKKEECWIAFRDMELEEILEI
jgi:hypothetical protein